MFQQHVVPCITCTVQESANDDLNNNLIALIIDNKISRLFIDNNLGHKILNVPENFFPAVQINDNVGAGVVKNKTGRRPVAVTY